MKEGKYSALHESRIAIVGMGYIGNYLYNYLRILQSKYSFKLFTYTRSNLQEMESMPFDYVFNCSGNTGDFKNNIWETVNSNLMVNQFLMNHVTINKALILLSSTRIYGSSNDSEFFFNEETHVELGHSNHLGIDFIYNGTKLLSESIAINLAKTFKYKVIVCRLSNLFGQFTIKDLNDSTYLKLMLRYAREQKTLLVNQNLESSKPYIYIEDAIDGILLSAIRSVESGVYNISSGSSYCLKQWIDYLGISYELYDDGAKPTYCNVSIEKATSELSFKPLYFLNNLDLNQIFLN